MVTHRAYKFRIYPSKQQEVVLKKTIGCCRFVYNWALEQRRAAWEKDQTPVYYKDTTKALTDLKRDPKTVWLNEVSSVCLQQALRNLDKAFVNFFKKKSRYPSFKMKTNGGSAKYVGNSFRLKDDNFYLAKIKQPINVAWSRKLPSAPSSCTVSQNAAGQWFVSFLCEEDIAPLEKVSKSVGVDVGVETFATTSDGLKFTQPERVRNLRGKLARKQKKHSRKKKGSKNREKARRKVARVHQQITNARQDFLHKLSTKMIRENQAVVLEDLAVSNMVKNRKLSRCISEQGWREFRTMLEYKAKWYGRKLIVIDRFFPSSKTCSACGGKRQSMPLNTRTWECGCGAFHDRDVNAARNILAAGRAVSACGA